MVQHVDAQRHVVPRRRTRDVPLALHVHERRHVQRFRHRGFVFIRHRRRIEREHHAFVPRRIRHLGERRAQLARVVPTVIHRDWILGVPERLRRRQQLHRTRQPHAFARFIRRQVIARLPARREPSRRRVQVDHRAPQRVLKLPSHRLQPRVRDFTDVEPRAVAIVDPQPRHRAQRRERDAANRDGGGAERSPEQIQHLRRDLQRHRARVASAPAPAMARIVTLARDSRRARRRATRRRAPAALESAAGRLEPNIRLNTQPQPGGAAERDAATPRARADARVDSRTSTR